MRKIAIIASLFFCALGLAAQGGNETVLYIYDEANENSSPYLGYARAAFKAQGIPFEMASVAEVPSKNLAAYDRIFIHGMVMAFNTKSMVRNWLKQGPDLEGKEITLLVTANRWSLAALTRDLTKLLKKEKATVVEAVSMATKSMDGSAKEKALGEMIGHLK
jgi:hypothetical protein